MRLYFAITGAIGFVFGVGWLLLLIRSIFPLQSRRQLGLGLSLLMLVLVVTLDGLSRMVRNIRYAEMPFEFLDLWDKVVTLTATTVLGLGVAFGFIMYLTYRRWPSDQE